MMPKRTTAVILSAVILFVACGIATAQSNAQAELRNRVLSYYAHFEREQYEKIWEMSSKKLREGNDNDKEEYIRYLRKHHLPKVKTKLLSLQVNDKVATVRVEINLWAAEQNRWLSEIDEDEWVFENGFWYFDSYQAVEETEREKQDGPVKYYE
jgi:hypothetical protein